MPYANWIACAAIFDRNDRSAEVIVERPTYEPLLRIPQALGHRDRRFDRRSSRAASRTSRAHWMISAGRSKDRPLRMKA